MVGLAVEVVAMQVALPEVKQVVATLVLALALTETRSTLRVLETAAVFYRRRRLQPALRITKTAVARCVAVGIVVFGVSRADATMDCSAHSYTRDLRRGARPR